MVEAPARRPAGDPMTPERNFAARIVVIGAIMQELLAEHLQTLSSEQQTEVEKRVAGNVAAMIAQIGESAPTSPQMQKVREDMTAHAPLIAADFIKAALGKS